MAKEPLQPNIDVDAIQALINKTLDDRTVFLLSRMYFGSDPQDDKLVTIGHVKRMLMSEGKVTHDQYRQTVTSIANLHQRIADLERPWWKRWFR